MADGFLIGEQFLGRIRSAVDAHEGYIRKEEPYRIQTRLEGDFGGGAPRQLRTIKVVVSKQSVITAFTAAPEGVELVVGSAIDLKTVAPTIETAVAEADRDGLRVLDEDDMPALSAALPTITLPSLQFGFSESFGVVSAISDTKPDNATQGDYELTVIVAGVFRCIVYSFGVGAKISGAFPIPPVNSDFPPALWRPYPVVATAGVGDLIATGAYHSLDTTSPWPRLYEAVIRL